MLFLWLVDSDSDQLLGMSHKEHSCN